MREKNIGTWKNDFLQSLSFLRVIRENNISGPQVYPHIDFVWIESSPGMREKNIEPEKFFCKTRLHPIRPYKGSRRKKKETQRGIANLTYKE